MQRPFEIKLRREMRNIISSHLKRYGDLANEAHAEDLVSDLMEAVKLEDYISMAQFEEYRDSWNKKYQELESSYIANINARDEEMEHSHRKIEELKGLSVLPPKLYEVAVLRIENPDASLTELAEMMEPPMKKSGINKRLMKIEEFANKMK